MSKVIPTLLAFVLISGPALAAQIRMTCKNPRRGYLVTFDGAAKTFRLGAAGAETFYKVEHIGRDVSGLVVRGKTVKDGPRFAAYFGGKKRIEFFEGGQVIQTDPCE